MSMAYSPTFVSNVLAGYILTVLGAVLALAAGDACRNTKRQSHF